MDLIVTHNNADFDALSSLVAAKKIYPDSRLLLPGSQERSVREFLSLAKDIIKVEYEKTCSLDGIKRLIIVDTRHVSRIGIAQALLEEKDIEVHIYDHHPRTPHDIRAGLDVCQEVGATVTIFLDILRKKGEFKLTPLEATMMLLGIYEETGSLTFRTTTKLDVDMVGFLLDHGANLGAVSSYLNRELSEEELAFLVRLINATEIEVVNGVKVAFSGEDIKDFEGEIGTVVHKLQEVEGFPLLFVFLKRGKKIRIVARSRISNVNLDKVMRHFGGGGHASAASAKYASLDMGKLKREIIGVLKTKIKVNIFAKDIMTSPVRTISLDKKIADAKHKLEKNNIKGMPVLDKGKLVGMITAQDIKKALKRGFSHSRVKGYMSRPTVTIGVNTPLHTIQEIMFKKDIGRLPVVKDNRIVGIVTRTDVLKKVHSGIFGKTKIAGKRRTMLNLAARMHKVLPRTISGMLRLISRHAGEMHISAFAVGGFVRDIILGVRNFDLDVVTEGDAIEFGRRLAKVFNAALVIHKKFGTASVVMDWPRLMRKPEKEAAKFKIDLATARKEKYPRPAALPTVEFSSLREDLSRRDFTINAMAVSLNRRSFGELIDFFGGKEDLEKGIIRVLHDASFIDDPTRIFRAVRFEQRFGFSIDERTGNLIRNAIKVEMFKRTENQRIRDEIILILREDKPLKAILRMKDLHELRFIHPDLKVDKKISSTFDRIGRVIDWYNKYCYRKRAVEKWLIYLMGLVDGLSFSETREICDKFVFRKSDSLRLLSLKTAEKEVSGDISRPVKLAPSAIYGLLEPLSFETILFMMQKAKTKRIRSRFANFFTKYSGVKVKIRGEDLKKEGLKPGPGFKRILRKVLYAKLDGKIKTKRDEIRYMRKMLKTA